ncbi:MAG: hypothetical protein NTW21_13175 [Verrucomicrobia bacterium]|nr:hypothetical protein [Verrucomicrobiota bacterium]
MTAEQAVPCARLLDAGGSVAAAVRQAGVNESTLRQALRGGRVVRTPAPDGAVSQDRAEGTTQSERSRSDAVWRCASHRTPYLPLPGREPKSGVRWEGRSPPPRCG